MEFVDLGKIVSSHGVHGEIKVLPFSDDFDRFKKLKKAFVRENNTRNNVISNDKKVNDLTEYEIRGCKILKTTVVLRLLGVSSVEDAEKLRNLIISIDKNDVPDLPNDRYYIFDLIGCSLFDENDKRLGIVEDVIKTGANDVYSVRDEDGDLILVPAIKEVVQSIDISAKIIKVVLPNGLLDVYKTNDINDDK